MKVQKVKIVKAINVFFIAIISIAAFSAFVNPNKSNATFTVFASCDMCKERIEKACDVKFISKAIYNIETQKLKVKFNEKKITELQIHQLIAAVGHDTEKVKASDSVYNQLPECCKYRTGKKCAH